MTNWIIEHTPHILVTWAALMAAVIVYGSWLLVRAGKDEPHLPDYLRSVQRVKHPQAPGAKLQPYQRRDEALFRDHATEDRLRRLRSQSGNTPAA